MSELAHISNIIAQIHEDYVLGRITKEEAKDLLESCEVAKQIETSSESLELKEQVNTALNALIKIVGAVA